MEIDTRILYFGERTSLRQIIKAKAGAVTVREAREFCAPTGWSFIVQVVAVTIISFGLGALFLPFLLVGFLAPFIMILRQRTKQKRWLLLLPADRDNEQLSMI